MSTAVENRVPANAPADPPINTLAALSLALTFLTVIGGIVTGHVALGQIRRSGERGRGLAIAALVIGYAEAAVLLFLTVGIGVWALVLHALGAD